MSGQTHFSHFSFHKFQSNFSRLIRTETATNSRYFSWADLLQQQMNFAQNQFFPSLLHLTASLSDCPATSFFKMPEAGTGRAGQPWGHAGVVLGVVRRCCGQGGQNPPAHNTANLACLEPPVSSFMRKNNTVHLVQGHGTEAGAEDAKVKSEEKKKRTTLSQNETSHENFQAEVFSLASPTAFEAFHRDCFIFPLQPHMHDLNMTVPSRWLINLVISPLWALAVLR